MASKKRETFQITCDDDGHYYVIPVAKATEWDAFVYGEGGEVPRWAEFINGPLSKVTIYDYDLED